MTGESDERTNPFSLFGAWFDEAKAKEPNDPNAMALATADSSGLPNVRMVLMKDYDEHGVVFYTNTQSQKGSELIENPQASVVFHWKSLRRQVRFRGAISRVTEAEADAYFASRPRDSRIGAWASQQSRPLEGKFALEAQVAKYTAKFGLGDIPRPPYWSGFRVTPVEIEFWREAAFRLHDRVVFRRGAEAAPWTTTRLFP